MSNKYHSGSQNIRQFPVDAGTVIAVGDVVCLDTNNEKVWTLTAANGYAGAANKAAAREAVADTMLGVAVSAHRATDPAGYVSVDISLESIWSLDLASAAAVSVGDLLEVYAANSYSDCKTMVAGTTSAVAVVVKEHGASDTATLCRLTGAGLLHPAVQT